jgi:hypothetical protein
VTDQPSHSLEEEIRTTADDLEHRLWLASRDEMHGYARLLRAALDRIEGLTADLEVAQEAAALWRDDLAKHKVELSHLRAENARLRDWKESALKVLAQWHALGDALQVFYPLTPGDDIPTVLARRVKEAALALAEAERRETTTEDEQ